MDPAVPTPQLARPGKASNQARKRSNQQVTLSSKKARSKRERNITEGSSEEVLLADVKALLASRTVTEDAVHGETVDQLPEPGSELEVEVIELSSTGDGLAFQKDSGSQRVYVVPFVVPGDSVRVKVFRHHSPEPYSVADLVSVTAPSPLRDDSRIRCKYFAKCAGCQFQMLEYDEQLRHKRRIVEKAYRNFSQLPPELIPEVGETMGSPLQFGYRTKLTPHFDGPRPGRPSRKHKNLPVPTFGACPDIGFMPKGIRKVLDVEDCPIGTDAVRKGMVRERARMAKEFPNYHRGATILLRESTERYEPGDEAIPETLPADKVRVDGEGYVDIKSCVTDSNATTKEFIGAHIFTNPAGSFFQNNNSILLPFTNYVREHVLPAPPTPVKYLIDAYSGSGLFTITLASLFKGSVGIDIAEKSIESARQNARLNGMSDAQCRFLAADARQLFKNVDFPPDETVVVLDPPRKGCDADFLSQLLRYGPRRVVYVSCNVHTQARDVGILVRGDSGNSTRYEVESLRGFDFFPQTGHVEGFAVLNRVHVDSTPPGEPGKE